MEDAVEAVSVELDRDKLRRMFPRLAEEMESSENRLELNSVRTDGKIGERYTSPRFGNHDPNIIDFIRRCDTELQAEEIITYMERRGEIDKAYSKQLRNQLKQQGVRSFGSKKEHDYYVKHGEL